MKKILLATALLFFSFFSIYSQEKETPPEGGTPLAFKLPEKKIIKLDNGLTLVMIPYGNIPKTTIRVSIASGNAHEKEGQVWLPDLMVDFMQEGSINNDAKQIADKIANMGGNLNAGVAPLQISFNSSVLYEYAPDAIALIAEVIQNPSWPVTEMERLKNNMKRNLTVALSRPQAQASQDFFETLYPDQPYGSFYSTESMIDSFTIEDIKAFYEEQIGAKRTTVYVAGKFNESSVKEAVKEAFSNWKEGPDPFYPKAVANTTGSVKIIDRPGAPQSTIMYGLPVANVSSEDHIALSITNSLLGGSFGSRITSNIREDKGYTYSPGSAIRNDYKSSVWFENADVTTQYTGASLAEINKEIIRLQNEPPTEEELVGIQNYEAGIFVLRNSSPGGIISQLEFINVHGLDESYLTNRVENIYKVTPEMVQEMTKKYIDPSQMTLIVVGDKKQIQGQIEETIKVDLLKQ